MTDEESKLNRRDRALEGFGLLPRTIVHFDIAQKEVGARWALHRFLHGRVDRKQVNGGTTLYRYTGLLHEGGVRLGQSVYMLPPELASRLVLKLRGLSIKHEWRDVYAPG